MVDSSPRGPLVVTSLLTGLTPSSTDFAALPNPWRELADLLLATPAPNRVQALKSALADRPDAAEIKRALATLRAAVVTTTPGDPWRPPIPFGDYQLPAFPTEALPPWLQDYVDAVALATQTPADLAGLLALGVLSTACAGQAVVCPWGDWIEPVNLYAMVVLPPGHRKSAVLADLVRPIQHVEAEQAERLAPEIARAESERAIAERALRRAEDTVARAAHTTPPPPEHAALAAVAAHRAAAPRLADVGDLAPLADWGAKLVGAVVRLAGLLHLAAHAPQDPADVDGPVAADQPIADATMDAACRLGAYATAHARAAYAAMGADPALDDGRYLLAVIAALGKPVLGRQELWQASRWRLRRAHALDAALATLVEHRYLRERPAPPRTRDDYARGGRKPAPTYLVNPLATAAPARQSAVPDPPAAQAGEL